ncbi:methionyl-tRNA formyltransferase [Patescibacteria group bacterium]|nr:methionyl-tRNA formyltransferase [Patescibacteria group bacterium]MBU2259843.1 methionyl-tRNA formyltransferase [Patescibacteria group bacterium]
MPTTKSIIFCGTPEFAVPSLEALIADSEFSVDLVITQPDKPVGRKQELTSPPVKKCAQSHGISVAQPDNLNSDLSALISHKPDFLVTVAYGQILKSPILDLPNIASVNIHPSLLPHWRGASPIQHAILAGDRETGVTLQEMTEELDAGPILAQVTTVIEERETATSLHDRLSTLSAQLLINTLKKPLDPKPQDESQVTFCQKLTRKDGEVDLSAMTAEEIDRHVRALVPWPGVLCTINGTELKLLETSLEEVPDSIPVECAKSSILHIVQLQPPGKKPMTGKEWGRGKHGKET